LANLASEKLESLTEKAGFACARVSRSCSPTGLQRTVFARAVD
jgi:hypothetical protein